MLAVWGQITFSTFTAVDVGFVAVFVRLIVFFPTVSSLSYSIFEFGFSSSFCSKTPTPPTWQCCYFKPVFMNYLNPYTSRRGGCVGCKQALTWKLNQESSIFKSIQKSTYVTCWHVLLWRRLAAQIHVSYLPSAVSAQTWIDFLQLSGFDEPVSTEASDFSYWTGTWCARLLVRPTLHKVGCVVGAFLSTLVKVHWIFFCFKHHSKKTLETSVEIPGYPQFHIYYSKFMRSFFPPVLVFYWTWAAAPVLYLQFLYSHVKKKDPHLWVLGFKFLCSLPDIKTR